MHVMRDEVMFARAVAPSIIISIGIVSIVSAAMGRRVRMLDMHVVCNHTIPASAVLPSIIISIGIVSIVSMIRVMVFVHVWCVMVDIQQSVYLVVIVIMVRRVVYVVQSVVHVVCVLGVGGWSAAGSWPSAAGPP